MRTSTIFAIFYLAVGIAPSFALPSKNGESAQESWIPNLPQRTQSKNDPWASLNERMARKSLPSHSHYEHLGSPCHSRI
ncbi:hypothetical protein F5148DRAFT_1235766 [Russula earlei]|uniref:Uncharacterized protein n=1 Tax=Russula earlei TaxID=71964 RepID=A0ACC0TX82_9AGAM|nr:hypothetical protein F5148DRAFT_1235766 [Russula earlei]